MTDIFTPEDMQETEKHNSLGPHYFAAQRIVDQAMAGFVAAHFDGIIKTAVDSLLEAAIFDDAGSNIQGKIWRMVDEVVRGILSGERWPMERWALGTRYECQKVREAVAAYIPDEIARARIADLEAEVKRLTERVEDERRRSS